MAPKRGSEVYGHRCIPAVEPNHEYPFARGGRLLDFTELCFVQGKWLLNKYVLAGAQCLDDICRVRVMPGRDNDGVKTVVAEELTDVGGCKRSIDLRCDGFR